MTSATGLMPVGPGRVLVAGLIGLLAAAGCGRSGGTDLAVAEPPPSTVVADGGPSRVVADAGAAPVLPAGLPAGAFALRVSSAAPVRVSVPGSGVDAPVEARGTVAASGALDLPPDAGVVAWYRDGPRPGAAGSAVLAAHVDYGGRLGVFAPLLGVEAGAVVDVTYDDGTGARFEVVDRRSYAKASLPLDELFRRDGAPRLMLVTCGGAFDRTTRSYADNVVVTAVPAG